MRQHVHGASVVVYTGLKLLERRLPACVYVCSHAEVTPQSALKAAVDANKAVHTVPSAEKGACNYIAHNGAGCHTAYVWVFWLTVWKGLETVFDLRL